MAEGPASAAEHPVHDRDVLGEAVSPFGWWPVDLPDRIVVEAGDAGAESALEAAAGELVDGHRLLGQPRGVAEERVGDQRADADAFGAGPRRG
jgi:hypothetical protein